jgi:hypothetical protein
MPFRIVSINWMRLGIGALLTAICALSVHAMMLQGLGIPVPDMSLLKSASRYPIQAVAALGLIFLWQSASKQLGGPRVSGWVALTLLATMLTETLIRGPFMEGYCTTAWTFAFVSNLQPVLSVSVSAALVVVVGSKLTSIVRRVIAALAISAFTMFVASPLIGAAMAPLLTAMSNLAPQSEWCTLPYGANVLIPAYLTFAEPVVACFAAAALTWDRLSAVRGLRVVQFTLIIVAIKKQLLTPFIYAFLAREGFASGLLSDSQFAFEAIALAVFTGLAWEWCGGRNISTGVNSR